MSKSLRLSQEYFEVIQLLKNSNFAEAESLAFQILNDNPKEAESYAILSEVQYKFKDFHIAGNTAREGLNIFPDNIHLLRLSLILPAASERFDECTSIIRNFRDFREGEELEILEIFRLLDQSYGHSEIIKRSENLDKIVYNKNILFQLVNIVAHAKLAVSNYEFNHIDLIPNNQVLNELNLAIIDRSPFSLIRLGDGEARFLIGTDRRQNRITDSERHSIFNMIWYNWFGHFINPSENNIQNLRVLFNEAIISANILGVPSIDRIKSDKVHTGFLSALNEYLKHELSQKQNYSNNRKFCDSLITKHLYLFDRYLSFSLRNAKSVSIISPHEKVGSILEAKTGLSVSKVIMLPAEQRLYDITGEQRASKHFPDVFEELMNTLRVDHRGDVFLVAGGLLGKIYCHRIKELGGIALDIGSIVDGWLDYDTRDGAYR